MWEQIVIAAASSITGGGAFALISRPGSKRAEAEKSELARATSELRQRNEQLGALYNVFAEITDNLTLRYVVDATLRETIKIMRADMAVVRSLQGGRLVAIGAMSRSGQSLEGLNDIRLGEGHSGRAAKRGKLLRFDRDGEKSMAPTMAPDPSLSPSAQLDRPALESGIIAPLIVGARVVGTLACWCERIAAYAADDERIMEMMASQVATAMVAAANIDSSERRAHLDPLTDLPNRRQLDKDLAEDLAILGASGRKAVVAMADIDYFKRFNDDFGHHVGDVTLRQVAAVLRSAVRENDKVYRYGGEEFLLVFKDIQLAEAVPLAERVRVAVQDTPLTGEALEPVGPVTLSIGLSALPGDSLDFRELISLADSAMYQAKKAGRNRIALWKREAEQLAA